MSVAWGDVPAWLTAVAALVGVGYGGAQLRQIRRQSDEDRRLAREGVAASWKVLENPTSPDSNGKAIWRYKFAVQNPGRLPISRMRLIIQFQLDVQRVHWDKTVDDWARTLTMEAPVIVGGDDVSWERTLLMDYHSRGALRETTATVTFLAADGTECETVWPPSPSRVVTKP